MVSYKELGLVNTREMFAKAIKGGYAIPAFNFNNMEQLQAIIKASAETKSPVILQFQRVLVTTLIRHCFATWLRVQLSMLRSWVAHIRRSYCTWTTAIASSCASLALIWASLL